MTKGNIIHHTIGRFQLAAVLLLLITVSCTTDETVGVDDDQPVIVTASATESALTRATTYDDDHGPVTSGTYYLSYSTSNGMNMAEVEFGEDGYGKAMVMPGRGELTWKQIGGTNSTILGLTNVSPEKHRSYDANNPYKNPIVFKPDEEQFVAGRYITYGKKNTNDILLASKSPYRSGTTQDRNSNYVHFELHHCMARVRVIVETRKNDDSFEQLEKLLENAKVDITDVVLKPYSFIPYIGDKTTFTNVVAISKDGTLDECEFGDINLLNTLKDGGTDIEWAATGDVLDENEIVGAAFTTYDILLPPQQLRANDRPRLIITVEDEEKGTKTYSGVLPHMMYKDSNPLQFEFLAEHLLTIRTVISNDPPELIFMPVRVAEWQDKGTYELECKEAGIYNEDDFWEMVKVYNNEDKYNPKYVEARLRQFARKSGDKWVFEIFCNLDFTRDGIFEKMPVNKERGDYAFDFNTWLTVKVDGNKVTEAEFKALLSGEELKEDSDDTQGGSGDSSDDNGKDGEETAPDSQP